MTLTATSFDWVRQLVHKESAIVLQPGKEYLVEARLLPIARQAGVTDVSQFVESVRQRPSADNTRRIVEALNVVASASGMPTSTIRARPSAKKASSATGTAA